MRELVLRFLRRRSIFYESGVSELELHHIGRDNLIRSVRQFVENQRQPRVGRLVGTIVK